MFNALKNNNYPQKFLQNLSNECSSINNADSEVEPSGFAVIPYVKGTSEPIKRVLGKYNVKTALKYFQNRKISLKKNKWKVRFIPSCVGIANKSTSDKRSGNSEPVWKNTKAHCQQNG